MKKLSLLVFVSLVMWACNNQGQEDRIIKIDWNKREVSSHQMPDSTLKGKSYLSIYSQIYSLSQHKKYNLTAMVSLRNTSETDTIYLTKADYYDTHGARLKSYVNKVVFMAPMETLDIVIEEDDVSGGTGSNFIFHWQTPNNCPEPIFEAVMSSMVGSQGLSFTTHAKRIQ